jgi:hypothetical protein
MSSIFKTGQVTCTGVGNAVPLTTERLECQNLIVKATGALALGPADVTYATGLLLNADETFSHDNKLDAGSSRFDLQPHQVYVSGASGVIASWVATGSVG